MALRDALEDADQALLIDTDTFFHSSPLRLFDRIQPGSLLCNAIGARYGEHRNFPLYRDLSPYLFERGWADDEMHQAQLRRHRPASGRGENTRPFVGING